MSGTRAWAVERIILYRENRTSRPLTFVWSVRYGEWVHVASDKRVYVLFSDLSPKHPKSKRGGQAFWIGKSVTKANGVIVWKDHTRLLEARVLKFVGSGEYVFPRPVSRPILPQ